MLIQKNKQLDIGDIATFKMVNGDEVVAKIIGKTDIGYILSSPCSLIPGPKGGYGLMQTLISADNHATVELKHSHIMLSAATIDQMCKLYIKTTSGLEVVGNA